MKKIIFFAGFILCIYTGHTQVLISILLGDKLNTGKIEFGLEGGWNLANIKNLDGAKGLNCFNLGFYFDFKLKDPSWMINTGVIVKSTMGADDLPVYSLGNPDLDNSFNGGKVARKINYFNVPVLMKYKFKNNIYLKAGTQLGLRYKAHDEFKNSINEKDDLKYKVETKDQYHPLDAGLAAGIGYHLMKGNGMNFGLQYYYGLVDIVIDDSTPSQFNRVLYVTACIPIGKNPKKKKTAQTEQ
ncbi:MAG TPA: porin family protein [Chitinophagaceae bacterium]